MTLANMTIRFHSSGVKLIFFKKKLMSAGALHIFEMRFAFQIMRHVRNGEGNDRSYFNKVLFYLHSEEFNRRFTIGTRIIGYYDTRIILARVSAGALTMNNQTAT